MIDITAAQATQTTTNGVNGDWVVSLNGEELYKLPDHFSVQETFLVRGIAERMMKLAVTEAITAVNVANKSRTERLITNGDAKLDALKNENLRLSTILESYIGEDA